MEDNKSSSKFGERAEVALGNIGKKVIKVADKNNDGKFDFKDISYAASNAGKTVKSTASSLKKSASDKAKQLEKKALQPIFESDLDDTEFILSKFIRVCERDRKRTESDVCQGAIGYFSQVKDLKYVNIYADKLGAFGVSLYPDNVSELYYIDPSDRNRYIALDDYFSYLKIARISELQKIAQDLGAKHFKVTFKEEKTSFSKKNVKVKVNGNVGIKTDVDVDCVNSEDKYELAEIAAEMECPAHEPVRPTLKYLQRDSSVQNLIAMRLDTIAPITHQKLSIKLSNSSGIKERDAVKIDAVLKSLKLSGNTTVENEAKNESRRYLEYEIDF